MDCLLCFLLACFAPCSWLRDTLCCFSLRVLRTFDEEEEDEEDGEDLFIRFSSKELSLV